VPSHLIFVYGSLKRGYALHHLLQHAQFLGPARTQPLYRLFDLGHYPGLVDWPDGLEIEGELYAVTTAELQTLDHAEGVAEGLYARRPILLQTNPLNHTPTSADAWFWLHSTTARRDCGHHWP
jgi:gamma-glutamylcyclotransferase (GGCT)/AIG2-like uncharacterized protein YtfP